MGYRRGAYRVMVGKPEGRGSLRRTRRRWEGNIKVGLQEVGWRVINWIYLDQDRDRWRVLLSTEMNLPQNAGNFLAS